MSDASATPEQTRNLTQAWWLLLVVGALGAVAGVIVLAKPSHSLTTLAVICGLFVLVDRVFELVTSRFAERGGGGTLLGILGIVVGILLIRHPIHGVLAIGLLIGIWLALLVGISLILNGVALLALGGTLHALRRAAPSEPGAGLNS